MKTNYLTRLSYAAMCALVLCALLPVTAIGQRRWRIAVRPHRSRVVVYNYQPRPYVVYQSRPNYVYQPYAYGYQPYQPTYANQYSYRYSQPYFANRYAYSWANPTYRYNEYRYHRHRSNRIRVWIR